MSSVPNSKVSSDMAGRQSNQHAETGKAALFRVGDTLWRRCSGARAVFRRRLAART